MGKGLSMRFVHTIVREVVGLPSGAEGDVVLVDDADRGVLATVTSNPPAHCEM